MPSKSAESKLEGAKKFDVWVEMPANFDPFQEYLKTQLLLCVARFFAPSFAFSILVTVPGYAVVS